MKLVSDWRAVLGRAWSVRLMLAAVLLSAGEVLLGIVGPPGWMPVGLFAALSGVVTVAALVARVLMQANLEGDSK